MQAWLGTHLPLGAYPHTQSTLQQHANLLAQERVPEPVPEAARLSRGRPSCAVPDSRLASSPGPGSRRRLRSSQAPGWCKRGPAGRLVPQTRVSILVRETWALGRSRPRPKSRSRPHQGGRQSQSQLLPKNFKNSRLSWQCFDEAERVTASKRGRFLFPRDRAQSDEAVGSSGKELVALP